MSSTTLKKKTEERIKSYQKSLVYVLLAGTFQTDPRVKQEVSSLNDGGFSTYVLSWDREGKYQNSSTENSYVKYVKLLTSKNFNKLLFLFSAILFQFTIFIQGISLLKKWRNIIIHANDFNTLFGVYLLNLFFPHRLKIVYDCHELTPAVYSEWYGSFIGKIVSKLEQKLVSIFDSIITVSPPILKYLSKISGKEVKIIWNYPTKKILPNISKEEARKLLNLSSDQFIVVYVGNLRYDIALNALVDSLIQIQKQKNLKENQLKIVVVGDGPLYKTLLKKADDYDLDGMLSLIGRVDRQKSLHYLRAADLSYILFTIKGDNTKIGMPWKLFESVACGTKVLVSDNTYAASFVKQNNAGEIVSSIDTNEITNNLNRLVKENNHCSALDSNNQFLWENQEKDFIGIYESLV